MMLEQNVFYTVCLRINLYNFHIDFLDSNNFWKALIYSISQIYSENYWLKKQHLPNFLKVKTTVLTD